MTVLSSYSSPGLSCVGVGGRQTCIPSASLTFLGGSSSTTRTSVTVSHNSSSHSGLLHCSFLPSCSPSFSSSFSGKFHCHFNYQISVMYFILFVDLGYGFFFVCPINGILMGFVQMWRSLRVFIWNLGLKSFCFVLFCFYFLFFCFWWAWLYLSNIGSWIWWGCIFCYEEEIFTWLEKIKNCTFAVKCNKDTSFSKS